MRLRLLASIGFAVLVLCSPLGRADPSACDLLLQKANGDLATAMQLSRRIPPELVSGRAAPNWQDFQLLEEITDKLRTGRKALLDAGQAEQLDAAIQEVGRSIGDDPSLVALRDASRGGKPSNVYRPGEYELKLEYQRLLSRLNHELPRELRIPGVRLPHDPRLPLLRAEARKFLLRQEQRFDSYLPRTGFTSLDELRSALMSYSDTSRKLVQMFDSDGVELAMNRPEGARWWVPRTGFQNQRITGSSRGTFNPDYRDQVEAKMTGTDLAEYKRTDNQLKPVYGYLKPSPDSGILQSQQAAHYGDDVYIFKKSHVIDRLTWTTGDSFGPAQYAPNDFTGMPQNWRGFFIPWKDRLLIVPDVLATIDRSNMAFMGTYPDLIRLFDHLPKPPEAPAALKNPVFPNPPTPPQPRLPDFPQSPPPPELVAVPPPPPAPVPPVAPPTPLLPSLKEGQSLNEAIAEYQQSDVVKQYNETISSQAEEFRTAQQAYTQSDAYREWQQKSAAVQAQNQKIQQEYQNSDAMRKYSTEYARINVERQEILQEFQKSEQWQAYQQEQASYSAEVQRINSEFQATRQKFLESEEYKAYQKAQTEYQQAQNAVTQTEKYKWFQYNTSLNPYFAFYGTPLEHFSGPVSQGYIELQYWGPLTLDDVAIFEFRKTPPSGEFLKALQKRGIIIRDGRKDPAVEWTPQ